ncbi:MFS transporter [uncultured Thiocystis sp.]|jgi:MFS family permease|uniref:MFS transporter n=1 Tax=uncultured Thiocystis sp. TaxID=1202134 RepID=UPI0025FAF2BD|nr:MFS transporter [uncultured Thiocystis sp.]
MNETGIRQPASALSGLAIYLGFVQFFLLATWTLYAIFLPGLLESVGVEKRWAGWVLLADQVLFAGFDIAAGFAADRAFRLYARIGSVVIAVSAFSCLAFLSLPWLPGLGAGPGVFLSITALWVVSSSALRSPLFGLLARHAAKPAVPRLAGLALVGLGLAAAVSPYLGTLMTGLDPRLPFTVSSLTLLLVAAALVVAERRVGPIPAVPRESAPPTVSAWGFLPLLLLAASAFQIAVFLNAGPRFLRETDSAWLPWLLPVFWIGFSLAVFNAGALSQRWGVARVFAIGCLVGGAGLGVSGLPGIEAAIAGYAIAGLGWGAVLASAFGLAADCGRPGRVATYTGILFATLAAAAFLRISVNLAGWPKQAALVPILTWAPITGWLLVGLLMLRLAKRSPK